MALIQILTSLGHELLSGGAANARLPRRRKQLEQLLRVEEVVLVEVDGELRFVILCCLQRVVLWFL